MVGREQASLGREMEQAKGEPPAYPPIAGSEFTRPAGGVPDDGAPGGHGGTLTVAAAPIGQFADASGRLRAALAGASVIAAEDTRRLRRLAAALGAQLSGRVVSYYDSVEASRTPALLAELSAGQDVLLITDAGMPAVSDPGYRLIAAAAQAGFRVTALPGPSAVTTALAVSGLPSDRFVFEGFPPRKPGDRARRFAELASEHRTLVFFESPRRLSATLAELAAAFGPDRKAAVCRELTKSHEQVLRGGLGSLAEQTGGGVLGEITLVVAGAPVPAPGAVGAEAVAAVLARVGAGQSRKDAITAVAAERGLRRRELYAAVTNGQDSA